MLSICRVSKYKRGFKISFAIDLGNWVLAFTTLDGLTRVGNLYFSSMATQTVSTYQSAKMVQNHPSHDLHPSGQECLAPDFCRLVIVRPKLVQHQGCPFRFFDWSQGRVQWAWGIHLERYTSPCRSVLTLIVA